MAAWPLLGARVAPGAGREPRSTPRSATVYRWHGRHGLPWRSSPLLASPLFTALPRRCPAPLARRLCFSSLALSVGPGRAQGGIVREAACWAGPLCLSPPCPLFSLLRWPGGLASASPYHRRSCR
ncbi:Nuclear pore complex protein Nup133 [Frankliniella fusca]|uniref:Nuclear pore complex protein Nup133 n=1 Tax=Frankliniella fusca TaxID=407009 RepID=A0AAE1LSP0_9NEOP|nr:Nuclear pore complex protein Nup133 [Frankliniella fusca]